MAAFAHLLTAPKVAIKAGKNTNTALRAADGFVKTELVPVVEPLKQKQPALYDAAGARGAAQQASA